MVSNYWWTLVNMSLKLWVPWSHESSSMLDKKSQVLYVTLGVCYSPRSKWIYVSCDVKIFFKVNLSRKIIYFDGVIWDRHIIKWNSWTTFRLNFHYQTQSKSVQQICWRNLKTDSYKRPIIHLTHFNDTVQRKRTRNVIFFPFVICVFNSYLQPYYEFYLTLSVYPILKVEVTSSS
jgi:hypothetical protein